MKSQKLGVSWKLKQQKKERSLHLTGKPRNHKYCWQTTTEHWNLWEESKPCRYLDVEFIVLKLWANKCLVFKPTHCVNLWHLMQTKTETNNNDKVFKNWDICETSFLTGGLSLIKKTDTYLLLISWTISFILTSNYLSIPCCVCVWCACVWGLVCVWSLVLS